MKKICADISGWAYATWKPDSDSWFQDGVFPILNVPPCLAESEKLETRQVRTADFCYNAHAEGGILDQAKALKQKVLNLAKKGEVFI